MRVAIFFKSVCSCLGSSSTSHSPSLLPSHQPLTRANMSPPTAANLGVELRTPECEAGRTRRGNELEGRPDSGIRIYGGVFQLGFQRDDEGEGEDEHAPKQLTTNPSVNAAGVNTETGLGWRPDKHASAVGDEREEEENKEPSLEIN
ncbi:hypothetical protein P154DRAFT_592270 [Amniculicola lignicola CBS 123094]|uniref:Uncharacterized protein n=1 Tax=Amniculicola lignicola CBS 123094 TaxID=1392246 RepID=A0A6A5VTV1_9PLEO|nr:hypothetical protein P154DRAFT_592270 [Amniculicola lignicola CBS 123094]